jgi:hypothetical protein
MRNLRGILCTLVLFYSWTSYGVAGDELSELRSLVAEQTRALNEQNARMAAQDARLADLSAKMRDSEKTSADKAKGVISIQKNAAVTIGGQLNTRYVANFGEVKSGTPDTGRRTVSEYRYGDFSITDAKVNFDIKVNDHFDAYLQLDLQSSPARIEHTDGIVQKYWIRWKNIYGSGFGILVGRNNFIFSDRYNVGQYSGLVGKQDDFGSIFKTVGVPYYVGVPTGNNPAPSPVGGYEGEGMFSHRGNLTPNHVGWDYSRTTQINPYWESSDEALRLDLTLMQSAERLSGASNTVGATISGGTPVYRNINYGLGTGTFRVMWKPVEGLSITGSVANFYQNNQSGGNTNRWDARRGTSNWAVGHPEWVSSNSTATNLSVRYNPGFAKAWNFWGKWTHGWNDGWTKNLDSDAFNLGASYAFKNGLTLFAQGDYFANENKRREVVDWHKANIWAIYSGMIYKLPYGVNLEMGWRHEEYSYKNRAGFKHTKANVDTVYGHVGFDF